jgi:hypothetical protein
VGPLFNHASPALQPVFGARRPNPAGTERTVQMRVTGRNSLLTAAVLPGKMTVLPIPGW